MASLAVRLSSDIMRTKVSEIDILALRRVIDYIDVIVVDYEDDNDLPLTMGSVSSHLNSARELVDQILMEYDPNYEK